MRRTFLGAVLVLGLLVCGRAPTHAGEALIQTTAPLADRSQESIEAAVTAAIDKAVRGASAMGFAWCELRNAQLAGNWVIVQILATDEDPDQAEEIDLGEEGDPTGDDETLTPEPDVPLPVAEPRLHI
jgi:hypothetical protein